MVRHHPAPSPYAWPCIRTYVYANISTILRTLSHYHHVTHCSP
jgi:hypothetical protein